MKKIVTLMLLLSLVVFGFGLNSLAVSDSVSIEMINNFYVGESEEGQSLIHSYIPENSNQIPVIMVPGLGLGANIYESTPDGRNGWIYDFLQAGYPVYTVDTSDLASAGISNSEVEATLSKWDSKSIWSRWGLGSAPDQPYEDGQFPAESFDQFYASIPMQIRDTPTDKEENLGPGSRTGKTASPAGNRNSSGRSRVNQQEVANIVQLLKETGSAILVVHSMGGEIGYEVARKFPELVKGIVAVEPVGSPTDEQEIKDVFAEIPYLGVYGDYLESRNQMSRFKAVETTVNLINENGGTAEVIQLTAEGINGNSHLMMLDKNSSKIGSKIIAWLDENIK